MEGEAVLRTEDVRKSFGGLRAVDGVTVAIRAGTLTAIIGPNGAGKSTLFNLLAGSTRPDGGRVRFLGRDVTGLADYRRARLGLGRTFQLTRALGRMTVLENLMLAAPGQLGERVAAPIFARPRVRAEEASLEERARAALSRFDLAHLADSYAATLSGGQKKLLELARVLMMEPKVVLLDEPMAGVNPSLARKLLDGIDELRRENGLTFVLVEHDLETVFARASPIVVMAGGKVIAQGSADDVRGNEAVIEAYLGG